MLALGWALIGLGVVGLFLPILQGVLFILLGLYVLSRESRIARHWFERLRARFPRADARLQEWRERWFRGKTAAPREDPGAPQEEETV